MHRRAVLPAAALLLLAPALAGCLDGLGESGADGPRVLATFYPTAYLATRIGGPNVTVDVLVPAGVEPHDWEPTTRDLARLARADLLIAQGADFEPWLPAILASLGGRAPTLVDTTAGLALREGGHAGDGEEEEEEEADAERGADHAAQSVDPHTWLDPVLFSEQAGAVARALGERYPEHAHAFAARLAALDADLAALDAAFSEGLADCRLGFVIASHDAFGYPAERYGFEVHAISGLAPDSEPDPRTVARLVDLAKEHDVEVVFFEELVSPRVAEIIAKEAGATTRVLSPVEGLAPEAAARGEDYLTLQRANLAGLREAMACT